MEVLSTVTAEEATVETPEYIYDLIQISILAHEGNAHGLITKIAKARDAGAEKREILRAMFRSDLAYNAGIENEEFLRLVESLQAGSLPSLSA